MIRANITEEMKDFFLAPCVLFFFIFTAFCTSWLVYLLPAAVKEKTSHIILHPSFALYIYGTVMCENLRQIVSKMPKTWRQKSFVEVSLAADEDVCELLYTHLFVCLHGYLSHFPVQGLFRSQKSR
jgi:F0F1-type ATP synthase membrane subunit a